MMAAWCGMHSDHSSAVELRLRPADTSGRTTMEINVRISEEARAAALRAAKHLFHRGLSFGTLFAYPQIRFSEPGSGTHCGSSFPMTKQPRSRFDTDLFGRPFGWKRVFAVDSSVLPSIPGTTLALSVMANAWRIGTLAPLAQHTD
jgi:choline dehydrogenase-like flavoprotein